MVLRYQRDVRLRVTGLTARAEPLEPGEDTRDPRLAGLSASDRDRFRERKGSGSLERPQGRFPLLRPCSPRPSQTNMLALAA